MTSVNSPRFQCTGCGQCCTGDPAHHYVEVSRKEQKRIYDYLHMSARNFRSQYIETAADESEGIRLMENGQCPFLEPDNRCGIYRVRPDQCATYPFWTELISSQTLWDKEKTRCEGIGRGSIIPEAEVRARMTARTRKT